MMLPPNPGVLDALVRDRQTKLRTPATRRPDRRVVALRVRIGHALIAAGSTLSGERVELPARPSALHAPPDRTSGGLTDGSHATPRHPAHRDDRRVACLRAAQVARHHVRHEEADTYEIGPEWIAEARGRAGDELLERIDRVSHGNADTFIHLMGLVWDTPAPRDIPAFLEHLRETDADEIRLHLVQFYARDTRRTTPPTVMRAALGGDAGRPGRVPAHLASRVGAVDRIPPRASSTPTARAPRPS